MKQSRSTPSPRGAPKAAVPQFRVTITEHEGFASPLAERAAFASNLKEIMAIPGPPGPQGEPGLPHIIQDEGVALATFDTLNFAGAGVTASVDTPGARITVTIPGGNQTPWTSDIDGATFSLNNAGALNAAAPGTFDASSTYAGVKIREVARAGYSGGDLNYSPRIAFEWAGMGLGQIGMSNDGTGTIRTFNQPGTAYAPFAAAPIKCHSTQVGIDYTTAAMVIRETNLAGSGGGANVLPRLAFWLSGGQAPQIGYDLSTGGIRTSDYPGTAYAPFACAALTANGDVNTTGVYRINGVAQGQTPWTQSINAAGWNLTGAGFIELAAPAAIVDVNGAGVTIREALRGGFSGGAIEYSPRIAFQWLSVGTAQLGMSNDGTQTLRTFNSAGTAYAPFACAALTANGDCNITGVYRVNGVVLAQTPWTSDIDAAEFNLNNAGDLNALYTKYRTQGGSDPSFACRISQYANIFYLDATGISGGSIAFRTSTFVQQLSITDNGVNFGSAERAANVVVESDGASNSGALVIKTTLTGTANIERLRINAAGGLNYAATESGANNALVATLGNLTVSAGLEIRLKLAHTLQVGANTLNLNGSGVKAIKSHNNPANNISVAYAVGAVIYLIYDGTQWQDQSQ